MLRTVYLQQKLYHVLKTVFLSVMLASTIVHKLAPNLLPSAEDILNEKFWNYCRLHFVAKSCQNDLLFVSLFNKMCC